MFGRIKIIDNEAALRFFESLACADSEIIGLSSKAFEIEQFATKPVEGYVLEENFPFCTDGYKDLYKYGERILRSFPNCCEPHKRLQGKAWFDKANYSYLPLKLTQTVSYTLHCIDKHIGAPSWYELITDYIEVTEQSYGQFPHGFGAPLGLKQYLEVVALSIQNAAEIPKLKKELLLNYLKSYHKEESPSNETDINILFNVYKKWLKLFPFELEMYFGEVKPILEKQLPFLSEKPTVNLHSGVAKAKLRTKASLFDALLNITDTLLTKINGSVLIEKGLITDGQKIQVDLINQERRQQLKDGYKNSSLDENHRFRKMIKDWLQDERTYWKKLSPVLTNKPTDDQASNILTFHPIDESLFAHHRVPFEIEFIYRQLYKNERVRFMQFKTPNYHFFTPTDLYYLYLEDYQQGKLFTDYLEPLSFDNVQLYYKAYGDGFLKGYNEFDEKIRLSTSIFNDKESIIKRVFEHVNTPFEGLASYGSAWLNEKLVKTIEKKIWFQAGIKAGENYKAWFFILNNCSYFSDLFKKYKPFIDLHKSAIDYWKEQPGGQGMHSYLIQFLKEIGEHIDEPESEPNDFLLSTIDEYLSPFKESMSKSDYELLLNAIQQYFKSGKFPKLTNVIKVRGKVNKKKFGWALNELYRTEKSSTLLAIEYLKFGKKHISIFKDVPFNEADYTHSTLYKYYTTKT